MGGGTNVRDVDPHVFVKAYAQFLKRSGKMLLSPEHLSDSAQVNSKFLLGLILSKLRHSKNLPPMIQTGSTFALQQSPDTSTSANPLAWVLYEKSMAAVRIVELGPDVTLRAVEALSVRSCKRSRKSECWKRIRKLEAEASREVVDVI
jgi:hypothetical protein